MGTSGRSTEGSAARAPGRRIAAAVIVPAAPGQTPQRSRAAAGADVGRAAVTGRRSAAPARKARGPDRIGAISAAAHSVAALRARIASCGRAAGQAMRRTNADVGPRIRAATPDVLKELAAS